MNIRSFVAATPRDALRAARAALGEEAVVLSNRSVAAGTELMVMAPDDMQSLLSPSARPAPMPAPAAAPVADRAPEHALGDALKDELRSMRGLLESQLATLAWNGRQPEAKARALREMLGAGFSAGLSRYIAEHMPAAAMDSVDASRAWMRDILGRNLPLLDGDDCLLERDGVFALVGPTGVGKTTSTAKLAARCVARHGASRIALVTTDGYRIGAFEQLRIYGKLLGVMVHSVRDASDLTIALAEMKHKHIVLIDTAGASQRDTMVAEQIAMLSAGGGRVQRLLCLNTTSTAETLDEVVRAYRGDGLAGCLLTKLDEASGIGGALDVAIRHKLPLAFVANGQRVPEDLHLPDRAQLLERAFTPHADPKVFGLSNHELPLVAANSAAAMRDPLLAEVQLG